MCKKEIYKWIHESYTKINEVQGSTKIYWLIQEIWNHVFIYLDFLIEIEKLKNNK